MNNIDNIFLIRHASSLRNESQAADVPDCNVLLSDDGRIQADNMGNVFGKALADFGIPENSLRMWCSPYFRTRETRDIILEKTGKYVRDCCEDILLTEWNFGLFDGLSKEQRFQKYPNEAAHYAENIAKNGRFYARPLNGESWQDVCLRVRQFFGTIVRDSEKLVNPVRNIAIVSHGLAIRAFVMMWLHYPVEWLESQPNPNNASIRRIARDGDGKFFDAGYIFDGFPVLNDPAQ